MKKFLDISLSIEEIVVEGQSLLRIHVSPEALRDWCLCIQLLQDGLIEGIKFRGTSALKELEVARGESSSVHRTKDRDCLLATFSNCNLDYVRHFFLRYYRDGAAEVDHIDIQTDDGGYIIIAVAESVRPVSPEEAKQRLDL